VKKQKIKPTRHVTFLINRNKKISYAIGIQFEDEIDHITTCDSFEKIIDRNEFSVEKIKINAIKIFPNVVV